jgi:TPR repeat protein
MNNLGDMYATGAGITRSKKDATKYFRLAAERGSHYAKLKLDTYYTAETEVDHDEGMRLLRLSAYEERVVQAQFMLGNMLYDGANEEKDLEEAAKLLRMAADQGSPEGQLGLGLCLLDGRGIEQDTCHARILIHRAAEQNNAGAQCQLGVIYSTGIDVPQDKAEAVSKVVPSFSRARSPRGSVKAWVLLSERIWCGARQQGGHQMVSLSR